MLPQKSDFEKRLIFGSDKFYEKLKKEYEPNVKDAPILTELYEAVKNDIKPYLLTVKEARNDIDDLLNEITWHLYRSLPRVLNNPDFFSKTDEEVRAEQERLLAAGVKEDEKDSRLVPPEMRRQSWLDTITDRRLKTFLKKNKDNNGQNTIKESDDDNGEENGDEPNVISLETLREIESEDNESDYMKDLDDDYQGVVDNGEHDIDDIAARDKKQMQEAMDRSAERESLKKIPSEKLVSRLSAALSLRLTPKRLLGFTYSSIIIPLSMGKLDLNEENGRTTSGKPTEAHKKLYGRSLGNIFEVMKTDLDTVLEKDLPDSIYKKLEEKLDKVSEGEKERDKLFDLSILQITYASNYANKKIDEMFSEQEDNKGANDKSDDIDKAPDENSNENNNNKKRR